MPLTITDPVLGELEYKEELEWWQGRLNLGGELGELLVWAERNLADDLPALLALQKALQRIRNLEDQIRRKTAERLTSLAEEWRDEEESPEPVTVEGFLQLISFQSLEINAEGEATIYYADGNLFAGHVITAEIDRDGVLTDAGIAG